MSDSQNREILDRNQAMLNSIARGDWGTYASFCSDDLSCFEQETNDILVEGLSFHRFYFPEQGDQFKQESTVSVQNTMARPHLRWLADDVVVLSYTRLTQRWETGNAPQTSSCCETRIWQRVADQWLQVHVHRS